MRRAAAAGHKGGRSSNGLWEFRIPPLMSERTIRVADEEERRRRRDLGLRRCISWAEVYHGEKGQFRVLYHCSSTKRELSATWLLRNFEDHQHTKAMPVVACISSARRPAPIRTKYTDRLNHGGIRNVALASDGRTGDTTPARPPALSSTFNAAAAAASAAVERGNKSAMKYKS